jgi:hypothetical protein
MSTFHFLSSSLPSLPSLSQLSAQKTLHFYHKPYKSLGNQVLHNETQKCKKEIQDIWDLNQNKYFWKENKLFLTRDYIRNVHFLSFALLTIEAKIEIEKQRNALNLWKLI